MTIYRHCIRRLMVLKEVQDSRSFTIHLHILWLLLAIADLALENAICKVQSSTFQIGNPLIQMR